MSSAGRFLAAATAEEFPRARPMEIIGDGMEPTLRRHRDIAMVMPISRFLGEGVYVLESEIGGSPELYRVSPAFDRAGGVIIGRDNKAYAQYPLRRAEFEERVLGKVIGKVELFDAEAYRACVAAMQGAS
jgi:hypothetical protein